MAVILRQAALELKSLLLLRWTLLLPFGAGIWMLLHTYSPNPLSSQDVNLYASSTHAMLLTLTTAIPLLLGVLLVRRDLLHPSGEWLFRLPLSAWGWICAKWIGGFLYMSLYVAAINAAYAASGLRHGLPLGSMASEMGRFALLYVQSYGISLALGLFLGCLLPLRFSLPAAFCAWVFGSLFLQAYVVKVYHWVWLKAFYLQPLLDSDLAGHEVWSSVLAGPELRRLAPFMAFSALVLLTAASALLGRAKPPLRPRKPWLVSIAMLLAAGAAFIPYASLVSDRTEHMESLAAAAPALGQVKDQNAYRFKLDRMKLHVVRRAGGSVEADAEFSVPTPQGRLAAADGRSRLQYKHPGEMTLLLYPSMSVRSVRINGNPVSWERTGDQLRIRESLLDPALPVQSVEVGYEGDWNEWLIGSTGSESFLAFSRGDGLYLPASIGWYPLPGGDSLLAKDADGALMDRPGSSLAEPIAYELTMEGFRNSLFATIPTAGVSGSGSKLEFQGSARDGITVIGGRFSVVQDPEAELSIITTPGNIREAEKFLDRFRQRREGLSETAGSLMPLRQVFFFPMDLIGSPAESAIKTRSWYAENDTFFIPETEHRNLDSYAEDAMSSLLLFGDTGRGAEPVRDRRGSVPQEKESMALEIRSAYAYMYNRERGSAPAYRLEAAGTPYWEAIRKLIDAAYERGHASLIREALSRLRERGLALPEPARTPAGERSAASHTPRITLKEFMQEWNRLMPEDHLPTITDHAGKEE